MHEDVRRAAEAWLAADPDPQTRAELEQLLTDDLQEVADRFSGRLEFGTAGLRAELGAGPLRMNRVVVRQTATGLATWLPPGSLVVIGHDARRNSDIFATDSAAVLAAAGHRVAMVRGPHPTPVVAFAVRHLAADAGIMVTASHNPAADNGYKVYLGDGAQLIPPADTEIEAAIAAAGLPPLEIGSPAPGATIIDTPEDLVEHYLDAVLSEICPAPDVADALAALKIVYTPLHGVGGASVLAALDRYGATAEVVAEQFEPDGTFPTAPFPNPEEPGALDLLLALARRTGADVAVANDPDADRLAVVGVDENGSWRPLTGNEVGVLLGDHRIATTSGSDRMVATTVVSSALLGKIAARRGVRYAETLTGFKWVARPAIVDPSIHLVLGYEEALGYSVNQAVRDKDGVAALVAFCALVAELKLAGRTVFDRLDELAVEFGLHVSASTSIRFPGPAAQTALAQAMATVRATVPTAIAGVEVACVTDFLPGAAVSGATLPPSDLLRFDLADGSWVQLRPSGTEPKLKVYVEVVGPIGASPQSVRSELERRAAELAEAGGALAVS